MERKFICTVIREDVFEITIDDEEMDKDLIPDYENCIGKLHGDKIKSLAEQIAYNCPDNFNDYYEGIGLISTDGSNLKGHIYESGLAINTISVGGCEVEVEEEN